MRTGRKLLGATNPLASEPGTIRGDFAIDVSQSYFRFPLTPTLAFSPSLIPNFALTPTLACFLPSFPNPIFPPSQTPLSVP